VKPDSDTNKQTASLITFRLGSLMIVLFEAKEESFRTVSQTLTNSNFRYPLKILLKNRWEVKSFSMKSSIVAKN
jgi:hypothetical protein